MRRSQAAKLIDRVREMLAARCSPSSIEEMLQREFGVEPLSKCRGEAHSNAYIDNCGQCAPRWEWVGEKVEVR